MIYVYDILVNFDDKYLLDFYEWTFQDEIENLKKVRLYHVTTDCLTNLLGNKVKVSESFLTEIYNTCEMYTKNNFKKIPYVALFSDGIRVLAMEFSQDGFSRCRSKLILEEEEEVLDVIGSVEIYNFDYETLEREKNKNFFTRKELKIKKYLSIEIEDAFEKKDNQKLKFLYEEYFDNSSDNYLKMKEDLLNSMVDNLNEKHFSLYELVKLSNRKKQM